MTTRERIHQLVEQLPDTELATAERVLAGLAALADAQPVLRALAGASEDDEPVTEEDASAIEEGERDLGLGRTLSAADARIRLGL